MEKVNQHIQQRHPEVSAISDDRLAMYFENLGRHMKPDMSVHHDTSDFMNLEAGDVIVLQDVPYLISRNEKESGAGMDDDPKYWVKRTINLETGETKIVKLVFFEEFVQNLGGYKVRFFRSPEKEAEVLNIVGDHPNFMHGAWSNDVAGNNVRVIDFIAGPSLVQQISRIDHSHETYFRQDLPEILTGLLECLEALSLLHDNYLVHGDLHWNHILKDRNTGRYRWIDFDYAYNFPENPFGADIFGVGRILANVIGQWPRYYGDISHDRHLRQFTDNLVPEDFSIIEGHQLMNLKKIYPYLPDVLNNILLHFSGYTEVFYESVAEITRDLATALTELYGLSFSGEHHD